MADYTVQLSRKAESYYKRVDANTRERLDACFETLERTPKDGRHPRIKGLRGRLSGFWRYRVGDLRVVYRVDDSAMTVTVVAIGARGDVY